jgi:hypothetical protein
MKERIEKVLSEILSDKYGAKVTLTFEKEADSMKNGKRKEGISS